MKIDPSVIAPSTGLDAFREPVLDRAGRELLTIRSDLLELSCARWRLGTSCLILWMPEALADSITNEDRILAKKIREYYSGKCCIWGLHNKELSKFRKDLYSFLNSSGTSFDEKTISLACRLPEFYAYDIELDDMRIKLGIDLVFDDYRDIGLKMEAGVRTLNPIKVTRRKTKLLDRSEYWLHDNKNRLHVISIDTNNPLKSIWHRIFAKGNVRVDGLFCPRLRNDIPCFVVTKWELLQ